MKLEGEVVKKAFRGMAIVGLALTGCAPAAAPSPVETSDYTVARNFGNTVKLSGKGFWGFEALENAKKALFDLNNVCQVRQLMLDSNSSGRDIIVSVGSDCKLQDFRNSPRTPQKIYARIYPNFDIIQISRNVVDVKGKGSFLNPSSGGHHARQGLLEVSRGCLFGTNDIDNGFISQVSFDSYLVTTPEPDCVLKLIQSNKALLEP